MGDTHDDPTDHFRTTQPHAGITVKDNLFWPGLILLAVAALGLVGSVVAAAYRHFEWLPSTVLIGLVGAVTGTLWLAVERRRVRRTDARWNTTHPAGETQPDIH